MESFGPRAQPAPRFEWPESVFLLHTWPKFTNLMPQLTSAEHGVAQNHGFFFINQEICDGKNGEYDFDFNFCSRCQRPMFTIQSLHAYGNREKEREHDFDFNFRSLNIHPTFTIQHLHPHENGEKEKEHGFDFNFRSLNLRPTFTIQHLYAHGSNIEKNKKLTESTFHPKVVLKSF